MANKGPSLPLRLSFAGECLGLRTLVWNEERTVGAKRCDTVAEHFGFLKSGRHSHARNDIMPLVKKRPQLQLVEESSAGELAQNKATADVARSLDRLGFERISIRRKVRNGRVGNTWERLKWLCRCPFWRRRIQDNAVLALQYTVSCWHGALAFRLIDEGFKARKNLKVIAVIHDFNRADVLQNSLTAHESRFFALCDKILVHCENMRRFFVEHGIAEEKLVVFEAFDYLMDTPLEVHAQDENRAIVNCCGNLSPHKCGCYRALKDIPGIEWRLYGPNVSPEYLAAHVRHMGVFAPDALPERLQTGWGLVWDGDSAETESGLFGAYQKYNHPHKLSIYLAAGRPVIVWCDSGVAAFVQREGVGIVVRSLREIPERLAAMSEDEYRGLCSRAAALGNKMRDGFFLRGALEKTLSCVEPMEA